MSCLTNVSRPPTLVPPLEGGRSSRTVENPGTDGAGSEGSSFDSCTSTTPTAGRFLMRSWRSIREVAMPSTFHWSRRRFPSPSAPAPLPAPIGAPGWLAAAPCWRWAVHWVHSHCRVCSQRRNACLVSPEHFLWYSVPQVAQHNGRRWARILPLQAGHFLRFLGLPAAPAPFPGLRATFARGLRGGDPGLFAPAPAPPGENLGGEGR